MAFPDGALDYSCAECTGLCCKGFGFGGSLAEIRRLEALYPEVGALSVGCAGSVVTLLTMQGGCALLDPDNFCRAEKEHGKSAKPTVCNTFPFNSYLRVGDTILVRPHTLCPLKLSVPPRPGEVQGTHEAIEKGLAETAFWDAYAPNVRRVPLHPSVDPESAIRREEAFRDVCGAALGHRAFGDVLREASADPEALVTLRQRVFSVFGLAGMPWDAGRDYLDDILLAFASSLRTPLLRLDSEGLLRALMVAEIIARNAAVAARRVLAPHSVIDHVMTYGAMLLLFGHGDESPEFKGSFSRKAPKYHDAGMVFASYILLKELGDGTGVMTAVERAVPPSMPRVDRWTLLFDVSNRLASPIERVGGRRLPVLQSAR